MIAQTLENLRMHVVAIKKIIEDAENSDLEDLSTLVEEFEHELEEIEFALENEDFASEDESDDDE